MTADCSDLRSSLACARDLLLTGNFVAMLDVTPDGLTQLLPVSASYELLGDAKPAGLRLGAWRSRTVAQLGGSPWRTQVIHVRS